MSAWTSNRESQRGMVLIAVLWAIVFCSVLAMGLGLTGAGYPYRLLYDYAPGWDGVRVPGRIFIIGTLFYALLAAILTTRVGLAWSAWMQRIKR